MQISGLTTQVQEIVNVSQATGTGINNRIEEIAQSLQEIPHNSDAAKWKRADIEFLQGISEQLDAFKQDMQKLLP